jgi:two-component system sensor histidine kinase UhpB
MSSFNMADGSARRRRTNTKTLERARATWGLVRPVSGYRRFSLYTRVLAVNAGVLIAATTFLALTPATVSIPRGLGEGLVLLLGLTVIVVANAFLLRVSFGPLARLVRMMRTTDLLVPGQRLQVSGGAEVRQVIQTFNEMLDRLESERQRSNRRAHTAQEAERRRIGQELHDEIGQRLTAILLQISQAAPAGDDQARAALEEAQELTRATLDEVGRIAWQLRPGILEDLGLVRALESLASTTADTSSLDIRLKIDAAAGDTALGTEAELVVFRVAQESLTNALRHARATHAAVELRRGPGVLVLRVADDGQGLQGTESEGAGLRGMRERALLVGATLMIESLPGAGTSVELAVPIEAGER